MDPRLGRKPFRLIGQAKIFSGDSVNKFAEK